MKTMKGPGIFLAQFVGPDAPFNSLPTIAKWAKEKGFIGVQIPTGEASLFDLRKAAESDAYCDEIKDLVLEWLSPPRLMELCREAQELYIWDRVGSDN